MIHEVWAFGQHCLPKVISPSLKSQGNTTHVAPGDVNWGILIMTRHGNAVQSYSWKGDGGRGCECCGLIVKYASQAHW